MNPSGPSLKPTSCETTQDALCRAHKRHSGTAAALWLPPEVNATAADKACDAVVGVIVVDKLATSFETKVQTNPRK